MGLVVGHKVGVLSGGDACTEWELFSEKRPFYFNSLVFLELPGGHASSDCQEQAQVIFEPWNEPIDQSWQLS